MQKTRGLYVFSFGKRFFKRHPLISPTNKEKNEERFSLRLHEVPCKGRSGEETLQRTMGDNMGQEEILRGKKGK